MKKEILFYADSPTVSTGFGNVARNIITELDKSGDYNFTILGIAYYGDPHTYPWPIYPAQAANVAGNDVYGRGRLLSLLATKYFDVLFMIHDTFIIQTFMKQILEIQEKKKFKIVFYFPIDCTPKAEWINEVVSKVDYPVAYSHYGKDECVKIDPSLKDMRVIYHGTKKETFFPAPKKIIDVYKQSFFDKLSEKFIVLNVNRNQPRKDLVRTFDAFAQFHKKYPDTFLYILAQAIDVGGNLIETAEQFGLVYGEDFGCPPPGGYTAGKGLSETHLNLLYNSADVLVSTSLGEGWGLSTTEAMATGLPVIIPDNTANVEIVTGRGTLCKSGGTDHWISLGSIDNNRIRPVVDVSDLVNKLSAVYLNRHGFKELAAKSIEWVPTWETVCGQWKELLDEVTK